MRPIDRERAKSRARLMALYTGAAPELLERWPALGKKLEAGVLRISAGATAREVDATLSLPKARAQVQQALLDMTRAMKPADKIGAKVWPLVQVAAEVLPQNLALPLHYILDSRNKALNVVEHG
jgi:hypothetical protein